MGPSSTPARAPGLVQVDQARPRWRRAAASGTAGAAVPTCPQACTFGRSPPTFAVTFRMLRLVLVLVAVAASARAQPFVPGYVVVQGDTLRGEVALGTEPEAARGVSFRPSADRPATTYDTGGASAFGADGARQYRRGQFPTASARVAPSDPIVFARVVRDGALGLLAYEPVTGRPTFALDQQGTWIGLVLVQPRAVGDRERRPYLQVLAGTLTDACGPLDIERLPYVESALARVVEAHNACGNPGYVAPPQAGAVRQQIGVSVEVAVSGTAGAFRRARRSPFPAEDPGLSSVRGSVIAEFQVPFLGAAVRPVLGAEFDYGTVRLAAGTSSLGLADINTAHLRLGVRLVPAFEVARVHVGLGLLAGPSVRRDRVSEVPVGDRDDVIRGTDSREFTSSAGQYIEVGAGASSLPFDVLVRAQTQVFTSGSALLPISLGDRYGVRSISVGVAARL